MSPPTPGARRFRAVLALLALASAAAALFPEVALQPLRDAVSNMRAPELAVPLARWLSTAGAVVFGAMLAFWPAVSHAGQRAVTRIIELPQRRYWLLVVVLATIPRMLVAAAISYQPVTDAWWYHEAATGLAAGRGFAVDGVPTAYRAPGYPFLLSVTYRLFGPHVALAWLWGVLATAVTVITVHFIARRLYGDAVGRIAALLAAIYPALMLMTGQALSDLPFVAGYLVLIAFAITGTPFSFAGALGAGIATGLLTLTRSAAIGLTVVVPLIWLLRERSAGRCAASFVVIALAFSVCIAPWAARNDAVFGRFVLGTNIGTNAYVGNHRDAPGGAVPDHWPRLVASTGANEAEMDAGLMREAIDFVVSNPAEALSLLPGKLTHLYLMETEVVTALFQGEHPSPLWLKHSLYGVSQLAYTLLLALFGLRALELLAPAQRPRGTQWTGWLLAGYFTLLCLVFHGQDRYRLPILPWMLIEASVLMARAGAARTAGERRVPREPRCAVGEIAAGGGSARSTPGH